MVRVQRGELARMKSLHANAGPLSDKLMRPSHQLERPSFINSGLFMLCQLSLCACICSVAWHADALKSGGGVEHACMRDSLLCIYCCA